MKRPRFAYSSIDTPPEAEEGEKEKKDADDANTPPPPMNKKKEKERPKKRARSRSVRNLDDNGFVWSPESTLVPSPDLAPPLSSNIFPFAVFLPELRLNHFYPIASLQILGRLACTCRFLRKELSLNPSSLNWLPWEWRKKFDAKAGVSDNEREDLTESYAHRYLTPEEKELDIEKEVKSLYHIRRHYRLAFQHVIHDIIRPLGYFKQVPTPGNAVSVVFADYDIRTQWCLAITFRFRYDNEYSDIQPLRFYWDWAYDFDTKRSCTNIEINVFIAQVRAATVKRLAAKKVETASKKTEKERRAQMPKKWDEELERLRKQQGILCTNYTDLVTTLSIRYHISECGPFAQKLVTLCSDYVANEEEMQRIGAMMAHFMLTGEFSQAAAKAEEEDEEADIKEVSQPVKKGEAREEKRVIIDIDDDD